MSGVRSFLTIYEMAALLGTSTKTIRRRIADGSIRRAPLGGRSVRIPVTELDRLSGMTPASERADMIEQDQPFGSVLGQHPASNSRLQP
jgi:excisionase family DNA binding protein